MSLPLAGRRVLVTRAAHQAGKLSDALRAQGATPVEVPVLEIRPPESFDLLDRALRQLDRYGWLIFTSANAVRVLAQRAAALGISPCESALPQVAAVGQATADAAQNAGFSVAVVPETYVAEALAAALAGQVARPRALLVRAAVARDVIPDALRAVGTEVDVVDAYRNVMPEAAPALLRAALAIGIHAATFTSSSSVTHLADAAREARIRFPFVGVAAISIGPVTSNTLRAMGWKPAAEASPSDISGLVQAVVRRLTR